MTINPTRVWKATARTTILCAATGCAAIGFAGTAAADSGGIDQPVGGNQCGGQPSRCAGSSIPFNLPPEADAVEVSFTKNNNPCADLNVQVDADSATQIPLGTVVPLAPGNHTLNVTPTCSTDLASWGGTVHLSKIKTTGKPADATVPTNAITVNVQQTPTKVTVAVQNTSTTPGDCTYDAKPTNSPLLPPVHRDFHLNGNDVAKGSNTSLDFPSPPLGTTYHVVVSCKAEPGGQEMGHFEQDVTGSL